MTTRKKYTKEFKLDAISLVRDQNLNIAEASRNLGVSAQMLGRWIKEEENEDGQAFRGNGKLTPDQEQIRTLKAQVKRLEMEREILKKATEDSSHQSNRYTKLLICMRTLNETIKTYIYHRRERPCF
jgi:transposase